MCDYVNYYANSDTFIHLLIFFEINKETYT